MMITVRMAKTISDLEAVWRLTHDVYLSEGYASLRADRMLRHYPHLDLAPETEIFVAVDGNGEVLGSISTTVDGPAGLHADDDFADVIEDIRDECRRTGKRLGCAWRAVTRTNCRECLSVIMQLISATLDSGRRRADVVLYTFNPMHESFYGRMLGLRTVAGPRSGHSVKGAPAILMRGEMSEMVARWKRVAARRSSARLAPTAAAASV